MKSFLKPLVCLAVLAAALCSAAPTCAATTKHEKAAIEFVSRSGIAKKMDASMDQKVRVMLTGLLVESTMDCLNLRDLNRLNGALKKYGSLDAAMDAGAFSRNEQQRFAEKVEKLAHLFLERSMKKILADLKS